MSKLPLNVRVEKFAYDHIMEMANFRYSWSGSIKKYGLKDLSETDQKYVEVLISRLLLRLQATFNENFLALPDDPEEEEKK